MSEMIDESVSLRSGKVMRLVRYGVFALLAVTVASIGAKMASQSAEIASLQMALGQVPGRDAVQQELGKLSAQVSNNHDSLKTLSASLETLKAEPAVENSTFEQLMQQVRLLEMKISQPVSADLLQDIHASISLFQKRIVALEQRAASPAVPTPSVKKATPRSTSVRAVPAPFRLTSIERRGGAFFVAVAPLQTVNLADIQLVGAGEAIQGWTLLSVSGNQAQFSVAGRTQTLSVQ